jgi:hypothetical protein
MKLPTVWISLLVAGVACAAAACAKDDTTLTVEAQTRVNQVISPTSSVDVRVHNGIATLSGVAASDLSRTRALDAVRSLDGVREVKDEIATEPGVTRTTGGTVPGSNEPVSPAAPAP